MASPRRRRRRKLPDAHCRCCNATCPLVITRCTTRASATRGYLKLILHAPCLPHAKWEDGAWARQSEPVALVQTRRDIDPLDGPLRQAGSYVARGALTSTPAASSRRCTLHRQCIGAQTHDICTQRKPESRPIVNYSKLVDVILVVGAKKTGAKSKSPAPDRQRRTARLATCTNGGDCEELVQGRRTRRRHRRRLGAGRM